MAAAIAEAIKAPKGVTKTDLQPALRDLTIWTGIILVVAVVILLAAIAVI
jgi:hypothetical protein